MNTEKKFHKLLQRRPNYKDYNYVKSRQFTSIYVKLRKL